MRPEAVIFDIGNVLVHWQPEAFYDQAIGADRRRALFQAVDLHKMNALVDDGAPFRAAIYDCADRHRFGRRQSGCGTTAGPNLPAPASNVQLPFCAPCGPRAFRSSL